MKIVYSNTNANKIYQNSADHDYIANPLFLIIVLRKKIKNNNNKSFRRQAYNINNLYK